MSSPKKASLSYGRGWAGFAAAVSMQHSAQPAVLSKARRRQAQLDAMAQLDSVVYAVYTLDGLVKIGRSENLRERMKFYRISADDMSRLLVVFPGSLPEERMAQQPLKAHLARGHEYFHPHPDVVAWVNQVRDRMGVPPWSVPSV